MPENEKNEEVWAIANKCPKYHSEEKRTQNPPQVSPRERFAC